MADWIIPCNPAYYDVFGAFRKLKVIDWRQSNANITEGDTVWIYVARPVKAVAFKCEVLKAMIPGKLVDQSDREFNIGDSLQPYPWYMRLRLDKALPTDEITFDRMVEAGLRGKIQGPRRLPEELYELFH